MVASTVGEAFCTEKIIVLVDSEYEAKELLRSCEEYCGVGSPEVNWSINSECTHYCDGRGYRFGRENNRPHKGIDDSYRKQIQGGYFQGYQIVWYSELIDELSHESQMECDVQALLGSVTKADAMDLFGAQDSFTPDEQGTYSDMLERNSMSVSAATFDVEEGRT